MISGDTAPSDALQIAAHAADLLIHEATFAEDELDRAAETMHSTAAQAATLAREAEVKLLALTHFSTRYPPRVLGDEATAIFPDTVLPRDFDTIEIPFAERGGPRARPVGGTRASPTPSPRCQSRSPIPRRERHRRTRADRDAEDGARAAAGRASGRGLDDCSATRAWPRPAGREECRRASAR